MSGAVPLTSIGTGYLTDSKEAKFTVVNSLGTYRVCEKKKKTSKWKEIIAEFKYESHARFFAGLLNCSDVEKT